MPESKTVIFDTKYKTPSSTYNNNNLTVNLKPAVQTPNVVESVMNFGVDRTFVNNKRIAAGNLAMVLKNAKVDIDLHLDKDGHLIVNAEDSKNYRLGTDGHLYYDYL